MIREAIEDAGFEATLLSDDLNSHSLCRIRIHGLNCISCSFTLEYYLSAINGVHKALVTLPSQLLDVHYDPRILSHLQILESVHDIGFDGLLLTTADQTLSKINLHIHAHLNESTIATIGKSLRSLPGVQQLSFDLDLNNLTITYEPDLAGPRDFIEAIKSSDTTNSIQVSIASDKGERETLRRREIRDYYRSFLWSLFFTVPVFLLSMVFMYVPGVKNWLDSKVVNMASIGAILRWILTTPVQFIIGRRFYSGAFKALSRGSANMDVLIALGTNAAYFYSVYSVVRAATSPRFESMDFFETSAMLISFILLGKYLEVLAKGKTSEAIEKLMNLSPETATLVRVDGEGNVVEEEEIDGRLVQKNDVVKIVSGGKVACDGMVVWGESYVDESMITGESRAVAKRGGDAVIGGTINGNGVLHVKATRVGSETALSQIVRLVEAAQLAKAPIQKFADLISRFFVPLVSNNTTYFSNIFCFFKIMI